VLVFCETILELESRDLVDHVIWWCRKYRQLVRKVGGFVVCIPLNVLMVHSAMLTIATDGERLTCGDTLSLASPSLGCPSPPAP
jgi:hypothetical protein